MPGEKAGRLPYAHGALVSPWRLFLGALIDGILIFALSYYTFDLLKAAWEAISGAPVSAPVIGFMSSYSAPAQNGYWLIVHLSLVIAAILCPLATILFGASPGKALTGVRFLGQDGTRASAIRVLRKTAYNVALYLLLVLPGPILGFVYGEPADGASLFALFAASMAVLCLAFIPDRDRRTLGYTWSGIWPVTASSISS